MVAALRHLCSLSRKTVVKLRRLWLNLNDDSRNFRCSRVLESIESTVGHLGEILQNWQDRTICRGFATVWNCRAACRALFLTATSCCDLLQIVDQAKDHGRVREGPAKDAGGRNRWSMYLTSYFCCVLPHRVVFFTSSTNNSMF